MEIPSMTTLDVVRQIVGRRSTISKDEMGEILVTLANAGIVELAHEYVPDTRSDSYTASVAWTKACRGITCISVDSRGLRDGQVRYDEPGSMHPRQHAELCFVPADVSDNTLQYMRRHADRVLRVRQDREHSAEIARQAQAAADAEAARYTTLCCDNGHRWLTDNPDRDERGYGLCPTCGEYWQ